MLEAVELPAGVADLDPGLADVDAETLPHAGAGAGAGAGGGAGAGAGAGEGAAVTGRIPPRLSAGPRSRSRDRR